MSLVRRKQPVGTKHQRRVRLPLLFAGLAELDEHEAGDAYVEQAKDGKRQVPCLFIDGKPLYESSDIIAWFEQNA